jgi:hypothetical protein
MRLVSDLMRLFLCLVFRFGGSFPHGWRPYCHVLNISDLDSTMSLLFDIGEKLYGRKIVNL